MTHQDKLLADGVEQAIEQAIDLFAQRCGFTLANILRPIIRANLKKGRVRYFLDDHSNRTAIDYVYVVAGYYEQWHTYIHHLQKTKQHEVWLPLYQRLQRLAYRYLLRRNFSKSQIIQMELHIECATEAAERLLRANFPYDTAFDPWITILVQRAVDRKLATLYKQTHLETEPVSAEHLDDWWSGQPDPASDGWAEVVGQAHDVAWAISQLPSEDQKQIIILRDLKGMAYADIAAQMGRRMGAIYKLHHDARQKLRKILSQTEDIDQ